MEFETLDTGIKIDMKMDSYNDFCVQLKKEIDAYNLLQLQHAKMEINKLFTLFDKQKINCELFSMDNPYFIEYIYMCNI